MSLLAKLAQKKRLKVDFHNHVQTGSSFKKKRRKSLISILLGEGFNNLTEVADRLIKSKTDIIYITNFLDSRYEDWTSQEQLELLRKAGYNVEVGDYYVFFEKDGIVKGLGKSQEVPTKQGHLLFAGLKRKKRFKHGKSLEETVAQVKDNELKIAEHPGFKIKGQNGIMAYSKNPKEDAEKIDVFERNANLFPFSFPFSLANYRAMRYSRKYKKPLIVGSDGHHPKDIGKTYNIFKSKDLDYSSQKALRDSINYAAIKGNFYTRFSPIPPWRVFHHAFMIGVYKVMRKLHIISKETFERYAAE